MTLAAELRHEILQLACPIYSPEAGPWWKLNAAPKHGIYHATRTDAGRHFDAIEKVVKGVLEADERLRGDLQFVLRLWSAQLQPRFKEIWDETVRVECLAKKGLLNKREYAGQRGSGSGADCVEEEEGCNCNRFDHLCYERILRLRYLREKMARLQERVREGECFSSKKRKWESMEVGEEEREVPAKDMEGASALLLLSFGGVERVAAPEVMEAPG